MKQWNQYTKFSKKWFALSLSTVVSLSLAACTTAPNGNASNKAQPSSTNPPKQESQPQASQPQKSGWEAEWDKTLAAAKKEGEVVIYGSPSAGREETVKLFEKAYPDIKLKFTGMRQNESWPKIAAEQDQGKYLTDIMLETRPNQPRPGIHEQISNYIIRPELKDDKTWQGGFKQGLDITSNAGDVYPFAVQTMPYIYINNDVILEGEIKAVEDLTDPKWKGKLVIAVFDRTGVGESSMTALQLSYGMDFIKKLAEDQKPAMLTDNRQIVEQFATGKYPIMIGPTSAMVSSFVKQGVVKKITRIDPKVTEVVHPANVAVLKNPPHPNAAKVFVDWILSKEAQTAWVKNVDGFISRRADVPVPEGLPKWNSIKIKYSGHNKDAIEASDQLKEYGKQVMAKQKQ